MTNVNKLTYFTILCKEGYKDYVAGHFYIEFVKIVHLIN